MIDELKFMLDEAENKPKAKEVLLRVAQMKEENQKPMLDLIKLIIDAKK
jgi:hypothetical protein